MDTGTDPGKRLSRRRLLAILGVAGTGLLAGCSGPGNSSEAQDGGGGDTDTTETTGVSPTAEATQATTTAPTTEASQADGSWRSTELTTVRGGETFTVADLDGPVVIQSFAVWCPKCQRQSEEMRGLGDAVTPLSLNTDPNEDEEKVREHADSNGFDWRFAVAPAGMTESLVEAFGSTVLNAPSTPIIVACGDGSAEFFSGSIQSASEIESAAGDC